MRTIRWSVVDSAWTVFGRVPRRRTLLFAIVICIASLFTGRHATADLAYNTSSNPVLPQTHVYVVYWNWVDPTIPDSTTFYDPDGRRDQLRSMLKFMGNTREFEMLSQYTGRMCNGSCSCPNPPCSWLTVGAGVDSRLPSVGGPTYGGLLYDEWEDTAGPNPPHADTGSHGAPYLTNTVAEVQRALDVKWPTLRTYSSDSYSAVIMVVRPKYYLTQPASFGCPLTYATNPYCSIMDYIGDDPANPAAGIHASFSASGGDRVIPYIEINYPIQYLNTWTTPYHEIAETAVDPFSNGWRTTNTLLPEIADLCSAYETTIRVQASAASPPAVDPALIQIQAVSSNAANSGAGHCVFSRADPSPSSSDIQGFWTAGGNLYANGVNWGGGSVIRDPAAVAWGPLRLDAVAINSSATSMTHYWKDYGFGVGTETFAAPSGYTFVGSPDISSWGYGRLDIFVAACSSICNYFHRSYDASGGAGWSAWSAIGYPGIGIGGITAVSWGPKRIDAFVKDADTTGPHLWHSSSTTGTSWSAWRDLGKPSGYVLAGEPDASVVTDVEAMPNNYFGIHVWFRDTTGAGLGRLWYNLEASGGTEQFGWLGRLPGPTGTIITSSPGAVHAGDQAVRVEVVAGGGHRWAYIERDYATFPAGSSGWTDLGSSSGVGFDLALVP